MNTYPEKQLLINYLLGICTPKEHQFVEAWLEEDPAHAKHLIRLSMKMRGTTTVPIHKERLKSRLLHKIKAEQSKSKSHLSHNRQFNTTIPRSQHSSQWLIRAVAVVAVVIIAAVLTIRYEKSVIPVQQTVASNELHRTLSNGQTSTFRFSDGSVITLNGGSTLKYPAHFKKNEREVFLEGEAFFDIARDESRPFIVHTSNATIQVLGTSFNIKAYKNEPEMNVAVVRGKVSVTSKDAQGDVASSTILEKDQWATYQKSGSLSEKGTGDVWEYVAWKEQVLVFNDKPFSEVARTLERWYGVQIDIEDEELKSVELKGEHKNVSLEQVLQSIQFVLGIDFTINDQIVRIKKK
jgi:ferric-dicitrate binding protein FerR (iron transport regulator)